MTILNHVIATWRNPNCDFCNNSNRLFVSKIQFNCKFLILFILMNPIFFSFSNYLIMLFLLVYYISRTLTCNTYLGRSTKLLSTLGNIKPNTQTTIPLNTNNILNTKMDNQDISTPYTKSLTLDNMCPTVKTAQYAVRGELVIRAENIAHLLEKQKKEGTKLLPFNEIVYCNIGNPQQLKQQPISFFRQVLALCECPELLNSAHVDKVFPADAIARARELMASIGNTGAYSGSQGVASVLKSVAAFIESRDGHAADPSNIFLTDGASVAVQRMLRLLIRDRSDGIMIPIPQYPLYSATIELYGGSQLGYYLNEESGWGLEASELERSYNDAVSKGITPRALVIINPGNPTGQTLDAANMREIVAFCHRKRIVLLADEVYQENVYVKETKPFVSFKKVVMDMGKEVEGLELVSFHSVSKGFVGECGKRGGYMELHGITNEVKAEIYKLASIGLCPNVTGQIVVDLMVRPPVAGEQSYDTYVKERDTIFDSLKRRANLLAAALNGLEGVTCNQPEGAMYAFPQIRLPARAIEEAKANGKAPDAYYCIQLLEATGICVVPGSGFGQKDGTYHFRTTFLPSEQAIQGVCTRIADFHKNFMAKYK
ncbi:alanine transaminase [Heterostelium album PN500]|uniref:Alanine transaminase n=1 Tax=Heterostelium pallidum (strain ATCC 26659 / Pp 5 / PN500) TaxID=670386 RepID=D3BE54_HETP5|nr:alanine transaminase [Heterostelium album PN500]EFA80185.1 alanine transaminase [Heterostelium album PN500]|eukprot:XP_020432305.1 alanine transaminase [Heterostelium album PN500]